MTARPSWPPAGAAPSRTRTRPCGCSMPGPAHRRRPSDGRRRGAHLRVPGTARASPRHHLQRGPRAGDRGRQAVTARGGRGPGPGRRPDGGQGHGISGAGPGGLGHPPLNAAINGPERREPARVRWKARPGGPGARSVSSIEARKAAGVMTGSRSASARRSRTPEHQHRPRRRGEVQRDGRRFGSRDEMSDVRIGSAPGIAERARRSTRSSSPPTSGCASGFLDRPGPSPAPRRVRVTQRARTRPTSIVAATVRVSRPVQAAPR